MSIETKKKFGVTFHSKMSSRKVTKLWFEEVSQEIRDQYPDLNEKMEACRKNIEIFDAKQKVKETKVKIADATEAAVTAASAVIAGIVSLPADLAAEIAAIADLNVSIDLAEGCKKELHKEIDKIVPEHLPDEENI